QPGCFSPRHNRNLAALAGIPRHWAQDWTGRRSPTSILIRGTFPACWASAGKESARSMAQGIRTVTFPFMFVSIVSTCHSTLDTRPSSFDDPIRPRQHLRWNRQAYLVGGFEIDDELELYRLFYGKVSSLAAFQDFIHKGSGTPVQVVSVHAVAHKPPRFHKICLVVYPWKPALCRELCNPRSIRTEEGAVQQKDRVSTPFACGLECSPNILRI